MIGMPFTMVSHRTADDPPNMERVGHARNKSEVVAQAVNNCSVAPETAWNLGEWRERQRKEVKPEMTRSKKAEARTARNR